MDRAEAAGFGVAVAGHIALLAVLTVGLASLRNPPGLAPPMEVSFVDEISEVAASPQPAEQPPAQSVAPALGPPEPAAPAPVSTPAPTPTPRQAAPAPTPDRAPPRPARRPPAPTRSQSPPTREQPRGSRLGPDLLKGIGRDPSPSRAQNPPGAVMNARAAADIASAIARQVQPCADRQVYPGPGAERIVTTLNLRLTPNGALASPPRMVRQSGVDDENGRYAQRVADLAIRSFVECAPLRGLPAELYGVPRGWSNFTMNYRLPG